MYNPIWYLLGYRNPFIQRLIFHHQLTGSMQVCLSSIEVKSHFEFIECNTSYCDENPCYLISDRNLVDTMVLEEIQIDN